MLWCSTSSSMSSRSYFTTDRLIRGSVSGDRSKVGAKTIAMFSALIMFCCWCSETLTTPTMTTPAQLLQQLLKQNHKNNNSTCLKLEKYVCLKLHNSNLSRFELKIGISVTPDLWTFTVTSVFCVFLFSLNSQYEIDRQTCNVAY